MDFSRLRGLVGTASSRTAHSGTVALTYRARFAALALLAALVLIDGMTADRIPVVSADESGTLTVTPEYANLNKTITVVVDDVTPGTTVTNTDETTDFTGNPYSMPAGNAGDQHIFRVQNSPIADLNGDGIVNSSDILTSLPAVADVSVNWLNVQNGTFSVSQFDDTTEAIGFNVTYRHDVVDTTAIEVRSSADIDGFVMTVRETGPATNIYTATFKTGESTSTTNVNSPTATERPVIKVEDGGVVTVEYADISPPTLISEAIIIDTTPPQLKVQQLPNGVTTSNAQNWVSVDITDDRSGIDLADVVFSVDLDRDGVFGEAGEEIAASPEFSSHINQGWAAFALLPGMDDGKVTWFATASDVAGNSARTDSSEDSGNQNHTFDIDTVPPGVLEVLLGDDYDDERDRALTNRQNRIRVNFTEPIDPNSVVPGRFLFGSLPAKTVTVYEDIPDAVFLEYEDLPSIAEPMQFLAGAVSDLLGLNSDRVVFQVEDRLGPVLEVIFDTVITRDKVVITSRSPENLATAPTVEINGVTFGAMTTTGIPREWSIEIDDDFLTGAAAGDGVKNVEIAGFDKQGNRAHGGVRREEPTWPENAHLFELDRNVKVPVILPAQGDIVKVVDPVITVSYADEAAEYPGDTHGSVTVISAKLDGFDVTALMEATTASSWTYQPGSLSAGPHEFVIQARDDAGNIHATPILRFIVDPPPEPTPEATEEPTPTPTQIPIEGPGETPPPDLVGTPTPGPTPEVTVEPTVEPTVAPTPEPEATATPEPEETPTPDPAVTPEPTVDLEATVQAIRDGDGSGDTGGGGVDLGGGDDVGYTLYGCGLPVAHSGVAGGDYTLVGLGMVGLILLARRRKSGGVEKSDSVD